MKEKMKKVLSIVLVLSLTFSLAAYGMNLPITKSKLTLKFVSYNWGDADYGNNMSVFKELEKRTNIHLDWQLLPADDNLTKLNLIMASGQLPDIISYPDAAESKKLFDKYAAQGAIIPLDDLITKYAPHIKALINNPPYKINNFKAELRSANGKMYFLPRLTQITTGQIFCIRKDWLAKVGMGVPQTTDELYKVLKAFKDKNVNGKGTVIPLEPEPGGGVSQGLDGLTTLMNAFGAHQSFYIDQKTKTVKYGPIESAYKDGLAFCNKLYEDGLIDKDYVSVATDAFRQKVAKNQVGMFYAWPLSGLGFNNTAVKQIDKKAEYVGMLPVKGPKGIRFKENPQAAITPTLVITKANKHPIETIKYLDYIYSKEGNTLMNYGIKGKDYTLDSNGNAKFTNYVVNNANGDDPYTVRTNEGMQVGLPFVATYASESQATPSTVVKNAWKLYTNSNVLYPRFPTLPLTDAQMSGISGQITDIKTFVDENSNKFIMGKASLADYNKFVQTVKSMGINNVLKVYNTAYKRYMQLNK